MEVIVERCAGLDVGKDEVVGCAQTPTATFADHRTRNLMSAQHGVRPPGGVSATMLISTPFATPSQASAEPS